MADYELVNEREPEAEAEEKKNSSSTRVVSLDVFRGLSVFLMIFVDYSGSVLPLVAHSPWNGIHLADFVMPFFLFIAGVSVALVHKLLDGVIHLIMLTTSKYALKFFLRRRIWLKVSNKFSATCNAVQRAIKLFLIGIFLQGGYFHGVNSLTFGVDIGSIRWFGILQRIAVGYVIAALCEIWFQDRKPSEDRVGLFKGYYYHWFTAFSLSTIYMGLLHGLYVPDWHVKFPLNNTYLDHTVKCGVRGDLGPACNSAGMIDRYILGAEHLYRKPVYRNLKQCSDSFGGLVSECSPAWCCAPFDPEGILSSFTAAVTCIIGLHFGHVLVQREDHKDRLFQWSLFSMSLLSLGLLLTFIGIPLNKPLYTISYMMLTSAFAGIIFSTLYLLVDVYGYKRLMFPLEWMGKHSLSIFVLVASNIAIIAIQGFYKAQPQNNIIHWIISVFLKT